MADEIHEPATQPEELSRLLVDRLNAGDVEGLVCFFEPDAAPRPTLRAGDLAVTSSVLRDGTVTVEVVRRQRDGTWLWVIDQPNVPG
jgi:hypothetical protein